MALKELKLTENIYLISENDVSKDFYQTLGRGGMNKGKGEERRGEVIAVERNVKNSLINGKTFVQPLTDL